MADVPVDSGIAHPRWFGGLTGQVGVGTFTATAAGTTTISDSGIGASAQIAVFPTSSDGGLLLRTKSCYVGAVSAGSFTFVVSSTGAGAPAGTETFCYMHFTES